MIKVLAHSDDIDVKQTRSAVHPFSLIKENENKVFFSETNKKKLWNFILMSADCCWGWAKYFSC